MLSIDKKNACMCTTDVHMKAGDDSEMRRKKRGMRGFPHTPKQGDTNDLLCRDTSGVELVIGGLEGGCRHGPIDYCEVAAGLLPDLASRQHSCQASAAARPVPLVLLELHHECTPADQ